MLYATTRDSKNAYTVHRALHESVAPDGGAFIPFRMPSFSNDELLSFCDGTFGQTVASVLNRLLSCQLTGWDVDFAIGRNAAKLVSMPRRIVIAELWHNPDGVFDHICRNLFKKICDNSSHTPSEWFYIAVYIAVSFALYGELCHCEMMSVGSELDISIPAADPIASIAAIYAKIMGLPFGTIILTGDHDSGLWELVHLGEINTQSDFARSAAAERLIHATLGNKCCDTFLEARNKGKVFRIDSDNTTLSSFGLFCTVSGGNRGLSNVNSIYRSNSYVADPATALCIGGLQDVRAKTGESNLTLIASCNSPLKFIPEISEATGLSPEKLTEILTKTQDRRL